MAEPAGTAGVRRPRSWGRRALRLVLYLGFLAVLAEGGAYVLLWKMYGERPSSAALRAEQRSLAAGLGTLRDEGVRARFRGPPQLRSEVLHPYTGFLPRFLEEYALDDGVWLNEERFYDRDSPVFSRDPDTVVIGITGGSVAGLFTLAGRKVLARELAAHPRFAGKRLRFAALAFGGFKQPQQLMASAYLLTLGGRVDVLINVDGFNEVALHAADNAPQGVSPVFPRSWYFRVATAEVVDPLLGELAFVERSRHFRAEAALESPLAFSWLQRLCWKLRDRGLRLRARALAEGLRDLRVDPELPLSGPRMVAADSPELPAELARIWKESSLQLDRLCRANGIAYFHFLQPNQYVPDSKPFSREELEKAYRPGVSTYGESVPAGYAELRRAAVELVQAGVRYADLTGIFGDLRETLYVDDCCHFNQLGNELMAHAIAEFVLAHTE